MEMNVDNLGKVGIVEKLYKMELEGVRFDDSFKIVSNGRDITRLYMNKNLQSGWYRKYMSSKELVNQMN